MAQYTQGLYQSIIKSRVFQFLSHRLDTRLVGARDVDVEITVRGRHGDANVEARVAAVGTLGGGDDRRDEW